MLAMLTSGLLPSMTMTTGLSHPGLERLFGPEQFCYIPNFFDSSLVSDLNADVDSLRKRIEPVAASPAHGSVEWLTLMPQEPFQSLSDSCRGLQARSILLNFVDKLKDYINSRTHQRLDAHCELKYAYYPCGGRYQKHVDGVAWRTSSVRREYSFIFYLNENWQPSDGGHLRVFGIGDAEHIDVAPAAGTLVVFKSDVVPHEVRPTFSKRLAIVGWLHRHAVAAELEEAESRENQLSPLALAIMEHYGAQGKEVKMT